MAKAKWGTKRTCPKCGARFYDLGKDNPVTCIECKNEWVPEPVLKSRQPVPEVEKKAPKKAEKDEKKDEAEELLEEEDIDLDEDEDKGVEDIELEDDEDVAEVVPSSKKAGEGE